MLKIKTPDLPKLTDFSIALGAIYLTAALIEGLGLTAAATVRLRLKILIA